MTSPRQITVKSHVARDFLQNANYFSTMPKVVWEYVSNALDNARDGLPVVVDVRISADRVVVADNASGMNRDDLQRFFQMHGQNLQRQRGRVVRGRFGTGKSAAFGIARAFRIETRKEGHYNVVELTREAIEAASDGRAFSVSEVVTDASTDEEDGTTIIMSRLFDRKRLDIDDTRRYVERHLGRHQQSHQVLINGHLCEFHEPVYTRKYEFDPPPPVGEHLGPVRLVVRVAPAPLDAETNGIDVLAHGFWHTTTLGDLPRQGAARRLFGEVTCDALETWEGEPPPFDNTRNNTLNSANPLVATLLGWVSNKLRQVVKELEEAEREQRKSEDAKKLAREAERIGKVLNDDFRELQRELAKIQGAQSRLPAHGSTLVPVDTIGAMTTPEDPEGVVLPGGGELPTDWQQAGPQPGDGRRGSTGAPGDVPRPGIDLLPGDQPGTHHETPARARRTDTFKIEFVHETTDAPRAHYDRDARTIFVNMDHPQIVAALRLSAEIESDAFRQVTYEVAFVEYALALMTEEAHRDAAIDAHDLLYDVRRTIDRIAKRVPELLG